MFRMYRPYIEKNLSLQHDNTGLFTMYNYCKREQQGTGTTRMFYRIHYVLIQHVIS